MDSDLHHHRQNHYHQQQEQQQQQPQQIMNSSLTRYRSAPSSYFSNLINSGVYGEDENDSFFNPRVSSPETDRILSRFMSSVAGGGGDSSSHQSTDQIVGNEPQFTDSVKQEDDAFYSQSQQQQQQQQQQMGFIRESQSQSQSQSGHDNPMGSMNPPTNLLRQSSSPAGFFAQLNMDKGYPMMRSMDSVESGRSSMPDSSFSAKRLKNEMGFPSGSLSTSGQLARIPENEGKIMGMTGARNDGSFGETHPHFPSSSWDDSSILSDSFLKALGESEPNMLSSLNSSANQNVQGRIRAPTTLTHHMSLPTSSSEMSAMEKLFQFQDSVPLKSRAKRGCATHPRSIAERVRRTRISERMRKLQELVPNMDKQTNTADMLDLAVDYIKELQKEAETLSDNHAKCTCPHKQKL